MATQENVRINFVTAYDGKGLNSAKQQLSGFDKLAEKAGKALLGLFAVQKVEQFAKASLKAFTDDQAAAVALTKTLTNLGLGFESTRVADFIQKLEMATGVLDDQLRPAFSNIVRATGDVAKSQQLLNLALDISAGTGRDLSSVSLALSKGYLGQTTALGRLGTGLSKAELASGNFNTIQQKLTKLFAGQASTAADTYKGKIAKLNVAFDNMKETVGKSLVDAFTTISAKGGSIDSATVAMKNLGDEIAFVIDEIAMLITKVEKIPGFGSTLKTFVKSPLVAIPVIGSYLDMAFQAKQKKILAASAADQREIAKFVKANETNINKMRDAAAAKAKADAAAQLKAAKDKLALEKASAALKLAGKVVDMDQIQLYAAIAQARGQDLDRLRLQQALLDGNAAVATQLANKILDANKNLTDLQGNALLDPFASWVTSMDAFGKAAVSALNSLKQIQTQATLLIPGNTPGSLNANDLNAMGYNTSTNPDGYIAGNPVPSNLTNPDLYYSRAQEIKVTVDPAAMAYGIVLATQNQSSNGTSVATSRNNPTYLNPSPVA